MRSNGILMHLSSLPSPYGVGSMGKPAHDFVDYLVEAGQSYWQMLPICPTSYGDSPYQSFSTFAGNPYFIDLEQLAADGWIEESDFKDIDWESEEDDINYGVLYNKRYPILRKAAKKFLSQEEYPKSYHDFCWFNGYWLEDYSLFMALKDANDGKTWQDWDPDLRNYDPHTIWNKKQELHMEMHFWKVLQYFFFQQWYELKEYANEKGIKIIGDLPIYVSLDSVDVWAHPELFQLDEEKKPKEVAGCPPDGFSATGQLWGNPLFDWEYMARDGFSWWVSRIKYLTHVYDVLRIDHFRGFESYYAIPYGDPDASGGRWRKGPGMDLWRSVEWAIGKQNIIAEDLGFLTEPVRQMLRDSGFPGMKVLEFAFDTRDANCSDYLPHSYIANCVAYVGTHDNDPVMSWMENARKEDIEYAKEYLCLNDPKNYHWDMIRALIASPADLTIVQMQDLLGLGAESRMNQPSTVGKNWRWRAKSSDFSPEIAKKLYNYCRIYSRLPIKPETEEDDTDEITAEVAAEQSPEKE